jgi:hypothetical protein
MLLINFFKKASVNVIAIKGNLVLMLFLYSQLKKYSIRFLTLFIFLSSYFVNATKTVELNFSTPETEKQILIQRAELAEQRLIIQERNYKLFSKFALVLILGFISFLFYHQKRLKSKQGQKEKELKVVLIKIKTQNKLHEQQLRISKDLYNSIDTQLDFIISSINNLKCSFEINDHKLTQELEIISSFTLSSKNDLKATILEINKI